MYPLNGMLKSDMVTGFDDKTCPLTFSRPLKHSIFTGQPVQGSCMSSNVLNKTSMIGTQAHNALTSVGFVSVGQV